MRKNKFFTGLLSISAAVFLAACSTESGTQESSAVSEASSMESAAEGISMSSAEDMSGMAHDDSGEIPAGLKEAENPAYKVGDTVTLTHGHMEGMEGAEATIVGAFDTVAYEVSYDPTDGGPREENHKWVVHEEVADAGAEPFAPGDEVVLEANHMEGMEGATATIEAAEDTTVYMIDYQPTTGGEEVKNHKWVTGDELSAE